MLKCLVVEDDIHSGNILKSMLEAEYSGLFGQPHIARSKKEALEMIREINPDIVFLDVELEDGTGFDILHESEYRSFKFIFTTAHDTYAVKAFKVNATDYLLKPFSPSELKDAIEKVINQPRQLDLRPEVQFLIDYMNGNKNRIALPMQTGFEFITVSDIIYCSAEGNYTRFHLKGEKSHLISKTLRVYENLLESDGFCRIHASYLINMKEVKSYHKGDGGYVIMSNGNSLEVSRAKKEAFISRLRF